MRILPWLVRIFDEYVRPKFMKITKPFHNLNQYGFTAGITYLMAALQRHKAEMFCLDYKNKFFSVKLDGQSVFDFVSRPIQMRELLCIANESGAYWLASAAEYKYSSNINLSCVCLSVCVSVCHVFVTNVTHLNISAK